MIMRKARIQLLRAVLTAALCFYCSESEALTIPGGTPQVGTTTTSGRRMVVAHRHPAAAATSSTTNKLRTLPCLFSNDSTASTEASSSATVSSIRTSKNHSSSSSSSHKTTPPTTTGRNSNNNPFVALPILHLLVVSALLLLAPPPPAAHAAGYGSLSEEQKVVAEAWRLVDNSYLDRTFHHQDWFGVREKYVSKKYKSMDEAHQAIAEMVSLLGDKYTRYLPPAKYQSLVDSATGTLAGVGIEISQDKNNNNRLYASDVQENSPAAAAGIRPGDVFVQVDGVDFLTSTTTSSSGATSNTPDDVAVQLRGPVGSRVGVVMERNDKQRIDVILQRQPITIASVQSYLSPSSPNTGVVRIKSFSGTTANTVSQQMADLQKKHRNIQQWILDCRGNPGGLLPGGVDTAALFLPENAPVVFVVNKQGVVDAQRTLGRGMYAAATNDDATDKVLPVTVLVDGSTASAAEVFTAALQENGRAVIAGQTTFGKGVVQTIRELSNGRNGGLAITVARYETPQHHDINLRGIPVDVTTPVDCPKTDAALCVQGSSNKQVFRQPATLVSSSQTEFEYKAE